MADLVFAFGANWARFLTSLSDTQIEQSTRSLSALLGRDLRDRSFLDIGSGSGLSLLAARRLGARVYSFDYDAQSVACTQELRRRFFPDDPAWTVTQGSVLDEAFLAGLGQFDVVYSWGVLHHTGALWTAVDLAAGRVGPGGSLVIAIYNDQGPVSRRWLAVKTAYNRLPRALRFLVVVPSFAVLWGPRFAIETLRLHPGRAWREYATTSRGMSPWRDVVDWVGGLPFEVARPDEVVAYCARRGFEPRSVTTQGRGHGCNEFVFRRARQEV